MSDLVRGKYHVTSPFYSVLGNAANATQSNIAARSNAEVVGLNALTDGAALTTQVATAVAIPVEVGDVITKVTVFVGATAAGTPTNQFAALYSGIATPALLAQSTDGTTGAIAASGAFTFTLASPVLITAANAPQGFIYASVMVKATSTPTLASATVATAVAYQWYANAPLKMGALTHGSSLTTTAPATIASPAAQAVTPIVVLS